MSSKQRKSHSNGSVADKLKTVLWIIPLVVLGWFVLAKVLSPSSMFSTGMSDEEKAMVQNSHSPGIEVIDTALPKKIADSIDEDLKEGYHSTNHKALLVERDNQLHAAPITYEDVERIQQRRADPINGYNLSLKQTDGSQRAYEDVRVKERDDDRVISAEDRINAVIAEREWGVEYDITYLQEFERVVKEEARKDGFEVSFNENSQITGYRPIKKKGEPLRFPQSTGDSIGNVLAGSGGSR